MTDHPRAQNSSGRTQNRKSGKPRPLLKGASDHHTIMAITQSDTTHASTGELDLAAIGCPVPSGTTCEVTVHGSPASFELELERSGHRWFVEGSSQSAELTGVYATADGDGVDLPRTVPEWIRRAVAELVGATEVTVRA